MKNYKALHIFIITLFTVNSVFAQLNPYIINFSKETHKGDSQSWSVSSNSEKEVYFANNKGVLRYNGYEWKVEMLPKSQEIFVVEVFDDESKIFIGSFEEFGYFQKNNKGYFKYVSLSDSIDFINVRNTAVWNIVQDTNGDVIFQSFPRLYRFSNNTVTTNDSIKGLSNIKRVGDRIFVQSRKTGIYELYNNKFKKINIKGYDLKGETYRDIVAFKNNSYILGYSSLGLLHLKDGVITVWNNSVNKIIKNKKINSLIWDGSYLYVGTVLGGLYIIDNDGNIVDVINTQSNLNSNNIHDISLDNKGNVWLAMDSNISYLDTKYPLHLVTDEISKTGITQDITIFEGQTYLATNQGLFIASDNRNIKNFKLIKGLEGQTWSLNIVDGQLFCGHSKGLFEIINKKPVFITQASGAFNTSYVKINNKNSLIINSNRNILLFEKEANNKWKYSRPLKGISGLSHQMEVDVNNNIWISHYRKGTIYKLNVDEKGNRVIRNLMGVNDGLPKRTGLSVCKFDNRIVFPTDKGFYTYDDLRDTIVAYDKLNNELGELNNATHIIDNDVDKWVVKLPEIALFKLEKEKLSKFISFRFNNSRSIGLNDDNIKINKLEDGNTYIGLINGFAIYQPLGFFEQNYNNPIFFDNISSVNDGDTVVYSLPKVINRISTQINYGSDLNFSYSSLSNPGMDIWYQSKLEGLNTDWGKSRKDGFYSFRSLKSGKYIFKVRAINSMGVKLSEISYVFKISKPWYLMWYTFFTLISLLIIAIYSIRKYLKRNKDDRKILLNKTTKALSEKNRIEKQFNSMKAENTDQSRELAKYSMELMRNNETLQELKKELSKIGDSNRKDRGVLKAISKVDKNLDQQEDPQTIFNYHFDQSNIELSNALKLEFPNLSPGDLRLSAYLRHNMSSKEIAEILHVSVRSIEVKRYRLRKKLGLDTSDNLSEFIIQYKV